MRQKLSASSYSVIRAIMTKVKHKLTAVRSLWLSSAMDNIGCPLGNFFTVTFCLQASNSRSA